MQLCQLPYQPGCSQIMTPSPLDLEVSASPEVPVIRGLHVSPAAPVLAGWLLPAIPGAARCPCSLICPSTRLPAAVWAPPGSPVAAVALVLPWLV